MKNFFLFSSILIVITLSSIFAGYENPGLVETPKKKIKYILKKIGLIDSFYIEEPAKAVQVIKKSEEDFFANSFTLEIQKVNSLNRKTAALYFDESNSLTIFTQDGEKIKKSKVEEINLPLNFTSENKGGVRSVIYFNKIFYALLSRKSKNCYYSSLINIETQEIIFDTKCIPDFKEVNFAGLGGAYEYLDDNLLLSIGTPTHQSDIIDELAQNNDYYYGKILIIKKKDDQEKLNIELFSTGHRNPQGLTKINGILFSTEHGPQGGDELNKIEKGKNYGWPIISLGTRYGGESYKKKYDKKFTNPIFSFNPSIAPSMLSNCPENLQNYYKEFTCLIGLTLKEMSLVIYLIDKKNESLFSYEKIPLDKRLRHFGIDKNANLHIENDGSFFFSADDDGIYKAKFKDFR